MNLPEDVEAALRDSGARVRHGYPLWLRLVLMRGVGGITLGRRIYLADGTDGVRSLRHELVHVRQIARVGLVTFYCRWVAEYVRNRLSGMSSDEAYRRISFEEEAFSAENI